MTLLAPSLTSAPFVLPTAIPSPTTGVWHLGPLPLRGYALCILAGILVAIWLTQRRLEQRGGREGQTLDVATWAVPFGMVGGRLYHVITTPQPYFGEGGHPMKAFAIWEGGLGIWGAIALGAVGAWIGCRRAGISFGDFCDSAAPGVLIAQAMGRFGNWFNNELYGDRTDLPWGLTIHEWDQAAGRAVRDAAGHPVVLGTFHPTFLYEALWCLLVAGVLMWLDAHRGLRRGQVAGLYMVGYCLGRFVIELMRSDSANTILGLRVNTWTSSLVLLVGAWIAWRSRRNPRTREPGAAESPAVSRSETDAPAS